MPRRLTSSAPPTVSKYGTAVDSIPKMFARAAELHPDNNCFGTRVVLDDGSLGPYEWQSYKVVYDQMLAVSSAVAGLGLKRGDFFGVYAANSANLSCCVIYFACMHATDTCREFQQVCYRRRRSS